MKAHLRIGGALLAAMVLVGCGPVSIRTAPAAAQACDEALLAGSLERQAQTGLGVGTSDLVVTPVQWPFGYRARMDLDKVVLVDETGSVVAREHDRVEVGGGMGAGDVWFACGPVKVVSNEAG